MSRVKLFLESKHRLGEAIIWHEAHACLYWIDLLDAALFRYDPATGRTQSFPLPLAAPLGAIVATEDADLLLVTHRNGLSLLRLSRLEITPYADPETGRDAIIYNDAKCDRWGRLWVGSSHALEKEPRGALWCLAGRTRRALGDTGFAIANGPAFSLDGGKMYFNDSMGRQTLIYDISESELLPRNRRVFASFRPEEGLPDGVIVDSEGCLWIAHWGGARITRWSPEGERLGLYPVPALNVTTMCFAGPDYKTLHITTARDGMDEAALAAMPLSGSLFTLATDVKGLPEPLMRLR
jgi:sugar lactone lactonase YvrE